MDKCGKCGATLDSGIIFCPYCGVKISGEMPKTVHKKLGFFEAFGNHWRKAFILSGRASLTEFWYSYIWTWIMVLIAGIAYVVGALLGLIPLVGWLLAFIFFTVATAVVILISIPLITVTVRRLHDTGRSAWWLILAIVSVGIIPLMLCALKGDDDVNEYGEKPVK